MDKKIYLPDSFKKEFSNEMRLLLSCCNTFSKNETNKSDVYKIIEEKINWQEFLKLAIYHQVVPIVYLNIQKYIADYIPQKELFILKSEFIKQKIYSMKLMAELISIVKFLKENGIEVICLKGPVLSLQLYGDISCRYSSDIDLLIDEQNINMMHHLLVQKGYITKYEEIFSTINFRKEIIKFKHHIEYTHQKKYIQIEAHYRFFHNPYFFPYNKIEIWKKHQSLKYAETELNILSTVDNIIFLFAHGAKHRWHCLKWLNDMVQLKRFSDSDWEKLMSRGNELNLNRPIIQGALLLNYLFDMPLPDIFTQLLDKEKIAVKLYYYALIKLNQPIEEIKKIGRLDGFNRMSYNMKLKKQFNYKLFNLRNLLFTEQTTKIVKLPDALFPIYYILNPFVWFYRKFINTNGTD